MKRSNIEKISIFSTQSQNPPAGDQRSSGWVYWMNGLDLVSMAVSISLK